VGRPWPSPISCGQKEAGVVLLKVGPTRQRLNHRKLRPSPAQFSEERHRCTRGLVVLGRAQFAFVCNVLNGFVVLASDFVARCVASLRQHRQD
jgi:hypothetical protein